jgi:hypothetical protein
LIDICFEVKIEDQAMWFWYFCFDFSSTRLSGLFKTSKSFESRVNLVEKMPYSDRSEFTTQPHANEYEAVKNSKDKIIAG